MVVRKIGTNWSEALILVKPETVVSWHRAGYRLFWKWRSRRRRPGRPKVTEEIRALIRRMKRENPTWGAPRIHGELLAVGPQNLYINRIRGLHPAGSALRNMLRPR